MVSDTVLTAVTLLLWGKAVHGRGQQLLQRAHVHALERALLGGSLTKINCKNEVSGFLSLAFAHCVQEGRGHRGAMKLCTDGQGS